MNWAKYISSAGDDDDDDHDGNDGDENEEEDDEQSGMQLPVDEDDERNDRADNDRQGCDYLVEDNHEMMTGGMLSTMRWRTMMCERAILIAPVAVGGWERVLGSTRNKCMSAVKSRGGNGKLYWFENGAQ